MKHLKYIQDTHNRKMYYRFTPAKDPAKAPILIILHGHTYTATPSRFRDENWNVLAPVDNYGVENCGSWWLGEHGDFFVKDLLHTLIDKIRMETRSDKGLFFWGSSMGGFGALLHGMLLGAKAVYANIPQIKLLDTSYSNSGSKKFFEPIFDKQDTLKSFNDVTNFLNKKNPEKNPLFFIAQSRFDYPHYMDEHSLYFFQKCKQHDINIHLEILPLKGHKVFYSIAECIKYFEKFLDINEVDKEFLKTNINKAGLTYNKNDIYQGEMLISQNEFVVKGFKNYKLLPSIDWTENPFNNRTWMWQLHQMSFIRSLLAYDIHYHKKDGVRYAIELIKSWKKKFTKDLNNEFAWHDHATAIRNHNLLDLIEHIEINNFYEFREDVEKIKKLLIIHAKQLIQEEFYSKATNHGLDQSLSLFELSHRLKPIPDTKSWLKKSTERVNFEISHAFADDGGHKENSPAYLNFGMHQVLNALKLGNKYEGKNTNIKLHNDILDKAATALTFMTRPDGKLPMIGDTKDFTVSDLFYEIKPSSYDDFMYSIRQGRTGTKPKTNDLILKDSGWAIFRSKWDKDKFEDAIHIVFKCGHLSNYHRHDDDLSFVLYAFNEDWLIDGGEYKHEPKDSYRIYFRSAESHNITMPYKIRAHRNLEASKNTGIKNYESDGERSTVSATSYMFNNFENKRRLLYDRTRNSIEVYDDCRPIHKDSNKFISERVEKGWTTYTTRFMIPVDKKINIDKVSNEINIIGQYKILKIKLYDFQGNISLVKGQNEPSIRGWRSRKGGLLEKAYSLELNHKEALLNFHYDLLFEDAPKNKIQVTTNIVENKVYASIYQNIVPLSSKPTFAYYLMYKDQKVQQRWYEKDHTVTFTFDHMDDLKNYNIIAFVKDNNNKRYQKKVSLFPENN